MNGEKVVNASEEDESEDMESEEETRRQPAEQTLPAVQETSESAAQVGEEHVHPVVGPMDNGTVRAELMASHNTVH